MYLADCEAMLVTQSEHGMTLVTRAGEAIHVPALPEQAATSPTPIPSMELGTMVAGIRAALDAAPVKEAA